MNIYYLFYCRAYDWYNTNGKKSKDNLRGSAIILLTGMPLFNLSFGMVLTSLIIKHTPFNAVICTVLPIVLLVFNWIMISPEKSETLRNEYLQYSLYKKKQINFWFYFYIIVSMVLLISSLAFIAYYKHRFGNYDK